MATRKDKPRQNETKTAAPPTAPTPYTPAELAAEARGYEAGRDPGGTAEKAAYVNFSPLIGPVPSRSRDPV